VLGESFPNNPMTIRRGSVDDEEEKEDDEGKPLISTKIRSVISESSVEEATAAATAAVGNPCKPMARIAGATTQFCRSNLRDDVKDTADLSDDASIGGAPL
jgi:hypothetical protein